MRYKFKYGKKHIISAKEFNKLPFRSQEDYDPIDMFHEEEDDEEDDTVTTASGVVIEVIGAAIGVAASILSTESDNEDIFKGFGGGSSGGAGADSVY